MTSSGYERMQAEMGRQAGYPGYPQPRSGRKRGQAAGAAWGFTILAGMLLVLGGLWAFFTGLAAILNGSFFVVTRNYAYNISISDWGWIHIGLGALMFVVGCCLLASQTWARFVAIGLAVLSALVNFLFLPRYPVWSVVMIGLDVVIIWALANIGELEAY
jgi:hypothetical protein